MEFILTPSSRIAGSAAMRRPSHMMICRYIFADEARQLQRDVTELRVRDFGYFVAGGRTARKRNGP